jgi:DNA primase
VLVDEATPLVEHYMQTLMKGQNIADPKVKAELTENLVPVIRQVSSPVERAHYAQKPDAHRHGVRQSQRRFPRSGKQLTWKPTAWEVCCRCLRCCRRSIRC